MQSSSSSSTYAQIQGTNYHHKTKKVHGSTSDIISNLPSNVIENILMCLPIRDAVRTCVLSSKWRYNWVKLPQLVFDDMFWKILGENQLSTKKKLLVNMYQVFLLHNGPILKFTLSISGLESCSEIDQFILVVSRNGVQEFTLRIWNGEHHKLPLSFFSCLLLTHLNLRTCVFEPPPTFEGFSRLTSLVFYEVLISADTLASLISSCPLLDQLSLESFAIFDHLEIVARNLTFLHIRANFKTVRFINTPLLAIVSIDLKVPIDGQVFKEGGTSNMIKLFDSLPVENLDIGFHYVKSLAAGGIPEGLPTTLDHLKILKLSEICFGEPDEVACVLLLIRSSPNLQKVRIEASTIVSPISVTDGVLEFWNVQGDSDVSWNQLREVEMRFISGMKTELEFIKLILAKSPMLESMIIEPHSKEVAKKGLRILKGVIRFRRASPNAEIIYEDPNED
uniref:F-box domain-containing protein n=1 Tax=Davidia involucrata TaxID=16924 RepID=A0A5B6ZHD4_DAVIN